MADKQRLFVDMDGTLAEFTPVDKLETLYERGYFRNLAPQENVVEAVKTIIKDNPYIEVNILSAYLSDSKYALAEKNAWLDEHLPEIPKENRLFVQCGEDKASVIKDGVKGTDYLLDDYTNNLTLWEPPGRGVKLLNGINHTNGTWDKDCVRFDNAPDMLADKIMWVMAGEYIVEDRPQDKPNAKDHGVEVETMGKEIFSPEQNIQINNAEKLIPNQDVVDIISNPKLNPEQMRSLIVTACSHPMAGAEDYELSEEQLEKMGGEIIDSVRKEAESYLSINVNEYAKHGFDADQIRVISEGIEKGIDVSIFAHAEYNALQMEQLSLGVQNGIDVSLLANPIYNPSQMEILRLGIESGLDVSVLANSNLSDKQMSVLLNGLKDGLDVSVFANPDISAERMNEIRNRMVVAINSPTQRPGLETTQGLNAPATNTSRGRG